MKSRALLILCILFLVFATMESELIDDIGLIDQTITHSNNQGASDQSLSIFESIALKISKDIGSVEMEGGAQAPAKSVPLTALLIMGLFGLAFWDRSSLQKQAIESIRQ